MKVIDLLNKIANGENVPKKIKVNGRNDSIYEWKPINNTNLYHYFNIDTNKRLGDDWKLDGRIINSEIKIIEENEKIEKIDVNYLQQIKKWKRAKVLGNKINELIDKVNELEDK